MIHITDPVGAQVVRWIPTLTANGGFTFTGTNTTHPCYNSHYVKVGRLVSFYIEINCSTITNFGTGQIKTELPFMPLANSMNHFAAWANLDPAENPDIAGHIVLQADHLANTKVLDLHWLSAATATPKPVMENVFTGTSPTTLSPTTKIYINGTYIAA
jgi:hypothetical protein